MNDTATSPGTARRIDLNCDMGEGFGPWPMGNDVALLEHVTSANVACGMHAGDPRTMHRTVQAAFERGVAVGAHPGLDDLRGFGRRAIPVTPDEAYDLVVYQTGALAAFARALGGRLNHVKPHGALYNMAARDRVLADALARAVRDVDPELYFVGLSGSAMLDAAHAAGLRTLAEVFADRTYQPDGTLTPRSRPDALITDEHAAVGQVRRMVTEGVVRATTGADVPVRADTVCVHGDQAGAVDFVRALRAGLRQDGVTVQMPAAAGAATASGGRDGSVKSPG